MFRLDMFRCDLSTYIFYLVFCCNALAPTVGFHQTGALLLAVCRGKVSEGLDFPDHYARAVITVRPLACKVSVQYTPTSTYAIVQ